MNLLAIESFSAGVLYAIFGALVFTKLKGNSNRWPYTLWIITSVLWFFLATGLYLHLGLRIAVLCSKLTYTGIVFIPIMMLHFCSVFLERPMKKNWMGLGYALAAFFAAMVWIDGIFLNGCNSYSWGYFPKASWLHPLFVLSVALQTNYFFIQITRKLKDPTLSSTKREQVRCIRRGLLWYAASSHDFLLNYGLPGFPTLPLAHIFSVIGLGHIVYAVIRHHLYDIQIIVRRTIVYSIASTVLTTLYVGILFITAELLRPLCSGKPWEVILVTCGVAAFCHPLIRRIERPIDRLLGRSQFDHGNELVKFSSELGQDQSLGHARKLLSQVIDKVFAPTGFVIYRRSPKGFDRLAERGLPSAPKSLDPDNPWVRRFENNPDAQEIPGIVLSPDSYSGPQFAVRVAAPMLNEKRLLGFILLGGKYSEATYTEQDLVMLKLIANQLAVALERPQMIKEVGSGFAHEIKTPLANITMPAELSVLELQDLIANDYAKFEEFVPILVKRLEYIVDQALFASSRVDAMQQLSEATSATGRAPIKLADVARQAIEVLAPLADELCVWPTIQIASGLTIMADGQQMEILLTNLIKNAIEACASSPEPQVHVRAWSNAKSVTVEVDDSGAGIQRGNQERMFEPHFSTKSGLTRGMGLYIAQRIVRAHQGTLAYERRGRRTVMRVTLPAMSPLLTETSFVETV